MHSSLIAVMVLVALGCRWGWRSREDAWSSRWQSAWLAFCLPPLMILSAAMAVLLMGHHGTMMGRSVSPLGCRISLGVVGLAISAILYSLLKALRLQLTLSQYSIILLPTGERARLLETSIPVAAQVGFWRSALLVSRGWLTQLSTAEQQAILHHEQAHIHYRDPLWFFGLGMVRRFTAWLPQTEAIWQELLLLREIRADRWAAQQTEPLLVAELLVKLTRQNGRLLHHSSTARHRLQQCPQPGALGTTG
ncbi:MAG: M56 family metallopeptidase [Leptolyngbyaceae cyanobacterium SM2_5_2]|nr:M56 family metallopeptidase [Leptolyngbyaceae cyanobacterium SM2_5_2]